MTATKKVALVTGASTGIGEAVAVALLAAGYEVVGTSRRTAGLRPAAGVTLLDLDVADDSSVASVVQQVLAQHGRIDLLVNNAGIGAAGAAEELSVAQAQHVMNVNFLGTVRMTRAVLPHMRAAGAGRVVNVSSVLGLVPAPFSAVYSASKHAVEGWSESVDHEVREHGVRVLLVEPAYTRTAFESNMVSPEEPLPVYADRLATATRLGAAALESGDDPAVVAAVVVRAAEASRPRLRYTAGPLARRVSVLRRLVPAQAFDKQMRKQNALPA